MITYFVGADEVAGL